MVEKIDLSEYKDNMKSYYLVSKIYEIVGYFAELEENPIFYTDIETNMDLIIDYISDLNFVFLGNIGSLEKIKETKKIGQLMGLQVFMNPNLKENKIIFRDPEKINELELIVS